MKNKKGCLKKILLATFYLAGFSAGLLGVNTALHAQDDESESTALRLYCEGIEQVFRTKLEKEANVPIFSQQGAIDVMRPFFISGRFEERESRIFFVVQDDLNEKFIEDICVFSLGYLEPHFYDVRRYFVKAENGSVDISFAGQAQASYPKQFTFPNGTSLQFSGGTFWYDRKLESSTETNFSSNTGRIIVATSVVGGAVAAMAGVLPTIPQASIPRITNYVFMFWGVYQVLMSEQDLINTVRTTITEWCTFTVASYCAAKYAFLQPEAGAGDITPTHFQ